MTQNKHGHLIDRGVKYLYHAFIGRIRKIKYKGVFTMSVWIIIVECLVISILFSIMVVTMLNKDPVNMRTCLHKINVVK